MVDVLMFWGNIMADVTLYGKALLTPLTYNLFYNIKTEPECRISHVRRELTLEDVV